jgi:hypothetical protein
MIVDLHLRLIRGLNMVSVEVFYINHNVLQLNEVGDYEARNLN